MEKFTLDLLDVIDPDGNGMDGTKSVLKFTGFILWNHTLYV